MTIRSIDTNEQEEVEERGHSGQVGVAAVAQTAEPVESTLAYFVFGDRKEYQHELSYSVLSAVRFLQVEPAPIRIALITEEGRFRSDLPVEHLHFSAEEFRSWCGVGNNVHRMKEFALLKALEHFRGRVAHIDPDTYFLEHPKRLFDRIGAGRTVMHEDEGSLGSHVIWRPILDRGPQVLQGIDVNSSSRMFNSGVIGLHHDDRQLLMKSVALEDELYSQSPVFNVEQFCTGAVLGLHTRLTQCNDLIRHYWGPERRFVNLQCARLFRQRTRANFDALLALPALPRVGFPPLSVYARLRARIRLEKVARSAGYRFAYIGYLSAMEWAAKDEELANAWLHVALDSLSFLCSTGHFDPSVLKPSIQRDFCQPLSGDAGWVDKSVLAKLVGLTR